MKSILNFVRRNKIIIAVMNAKIDFFVTKNERMLKRKEELKKRYNKDDDTAAKKIAYGAIKYSILRVSPEKNVVFSWEQALSFEGETCPYIQYAYARISSILKKHGKKVDSKINFSLLDKAEEIDIMTKLSEFNELVDSATGQLKPHFIANYSYELAKAFNEYYHKYNILKEKEDVKKARLMLIECVRHVLKNSLGLLGIDVLEKM